MTGCLRGSGRCHPGLQRCRLPVPARGRYLGDGLQLLLHKGVYKGDWLHNWVAGQLADAGVRTWGDLRISREDDPDSALEPERSYKLVVIVSDVSDNRMRRLPWDYKWLGFSPDRVDEMPVADAVRASASIPRAWRPGTSSSTPGASTAISTPTGSRPAAPPRATPRSLLGDGYSA